MNQRSAVRKIAAGVAVAGALLALLLWLDWMRSPERAAQVRERAIATVEQEIRIQTAERLRDQAECRALAVELGDNTGPAVQACREANATLERARQQTLQALRQRLEKLTAERDAAPAN